MSQKYRIGETKYYLGVTPNGFEIYTVRTREREGKRVEEFEFRWHIGQLVNLLPFVSQLLLSELSPDNPTPLLRDLVPVYEQALQELKILHPLFVQLEEQRRQLQAGIVKEASIS